MKNNLKLLGLICASVIIASCGSGGGSSSSGGGSTPEPAELTSYKSEFIGSDAQERTIASINTTFNSSQSVSANSISASNNCFVLGNNFSGKNYSIKINSSQWWSTGQINFDIVNTCNTAQTLDNIPVTFSNILVNGKAPASIDDYVAQSGVPYLTVTNAVAKTGKLFLSTPSCSGEYCSWAQIPAGGVGHLVLQLSLGSAINSLTLGSVSINESSPTPPPPPPPPLPGSLNVKISTESLASVCNNCKLTLHILTPASTILTESNITVGKIATTYNYSNLLPGNYTLSIDQSTLPSGATTIYSPNKTISVNSNQSSNAGISFSYTPPVQLGNIAINLNNIAGESTLTSIGTINGNVTDNDSGTQYTFSVTLGGNYQLTNVPAQHHYTVQLQGIANSRYGAFYAPISESGIVVTSGSTANVNLNYAKVSPTNLYNVNFNVVGAESFAAQSIAFVDSTQTYKFVVNNLVNTSYVFPNNYPIVITTQPPAGYTLVVSESVIIQQLSGKTVTFTYAPIPPSSIVGYYNYNQPFKDYNNTVILESFIGQVATKSGVKSVEFVSNFPVNVSYGYCFGQVLGGSNLNVTSVPIDGVGKYANVIAVSTSSNVNLNLGQSCSLALGSNVGNAKVLDDAVDLIVYSLKVSGQSIPLYQPCSANNCKDPGNGYTNAGYYAEWSVWGRQYNPQTMPFNNINQIFFAFIGFDPATGNVKSLDSGADTWGLFATTKAVLQYPYMKASLSFGGWTNNGATTAPMFNKLTANDAAMNNFVNQSVALMRRVGFTGIDIDWEWWSDDSPAVAPAKTQLKLLQALKAALDIASLQDGRHYELTIATNISANATNAMQSPSNPNSVPDFWFQVNKLVDEIDMMSYDIHGGFDVGKPAYFQAPWTVESTSPYYSGESTEAIGAGILAYQKAGVTNKKLVVGVPLYARTMQITSVGSLGGLYQNVVTTGFGDYEKGILDYKCLINPISNPVTGCGSPSPISDINSLSFVDQNSQGANLTLWKKYSESIALQPWAYNNSNFVTYDNPYTTAAKAQKVKSLGLGGLMYWELDGDSTDPTKSIVQAGKNALN